MSENFDIIIIGAAQLGLKTACVESRGTLGGTCLNVGCIPSKSLLNLSENFHKAKKDFFNQGIEVSDVKLNVEKMMNNKNKSVQVLTKGIEFLFKKNKVTYLKGKGVIFSPTNVVVYDQGKKSSYNTKNIVIATGSAAASLRTFFELCTKVFSSYRRWLYWFRNGFSVEKIGSRSYCN